MIEYGILVTEYKLNQFRELGDWVVHLEIPGYKASTDDYRSETGTEVLNKIAPLGWKVTAITANQLKPDSVTITTIMRLEREMLAEETTHNEVASATT